MRGAGDDVWKFQLWNVVPRTVQITDVDFEDDEMFRGDNGSATAGIRVAEPQQLRVFWIWTKIQAFGDIHATTLSIPMGGENKSRRLSLILAAWFTRLLAANQKSIDD